MGEARVAAAALAPSRLSRARREIFDAICAPIGRFEAQIERSGDYLQDLGKFLLLVKECLVRVDLTIMNIGVRTRVGIWLLLVAALVLLSGLVLLDTARTQLEQSASESLEQLVRLEQVRLLGELDQQRGAVELVARDPQLIDTFFGEGPRLASEGGIDELLTGSNVSGQRFLALRIVNRSGGIIDETEGFDWNYGGLVGLAMDDRAVLVGLAHQHGTEGQLVDGNEVDTFGIVSPIVSPRGEVLGALLVEADLSQVTWLSSRYESAGETTEAFMFQRLPDGTCQLLTNLRFDRSAAFSSLDGAFASECTDLSTERIVEAQDYRGVDSMSAWMEVPGTEWGVVVKMDDSEVFSLLNRLRQTIFGSGLVASIMLLFGWFTLVRPIGKRLSRTAATAEQLASGNYNALIGDSRSDEIGRMSESMDRLARDLAHDIERRERAEAQLRVRADFDGLTGLMNRHRMNTAMLKLAETSTDYSVVFLDLDGFKQINDTWGHSVGDDVLRLAATRIKASLEHAGIIGEIGRWGGDEFVILCPSSMADDLKPLIDQLTTYFESPFRTEAGRHLVGVSIGVADTSGGETTEEIMSAADESMYRMKRRRDGRTRLSPQALKLVEAALEEDRVESFLQPLIFVDGSGERHLFGAEALVRIRNVDGSLENPGSFLPGIGASAQALALDLRVLRNAASTAASLHRRGLVPPNFYISANFGAAAMADERLGDKIVAIVDECGLAPENLVVEIPETAKDVDIDLITRLRDRGILIAIDDVGCQYSNLGRLVDIPADIAKIDRRWLPTEFPCDPSKVELIENLIQQCTMLDLAVVVEGIETQEQLELVRSLGIDRVQGFLFGRPEDTLTFEEFWGREDGESRRPVSESPETTAHLSALPQ